MTAPSKSHPPAAVEQKATVASDRLLPQLYTLWRALRASRHWRSVGLLAAGIVLVVCLNAVGQIRLNTWQGTFYDAIEQRAVAAFTAQLLVFLVIAGGLLVLVVAQTWLQQMITVRLREWLAHDLLDQWLAPRRAYLLSFAGEIGVNPDQRIAQDALHLSELSAILGVGLLQSSLLLVSFVGVLWILSANVMFEVGGQSFAIPGYMVWCAIAYALGGSLLAWRVGRPLVSLNAERYQRESDLRFALVRVNEHADGIALHAGEADERRILDEPVDRVIAMMAQLAGGIARLTWFTSGYGWLAIVAPIIVAAPGYFDGDLSFGALMMVVGAFNQVQSSLRWFVDNLGADRRLARDAATYRELSRRLARVETDRCGDRSDRDRRFGRGEARARGSGGRPARRMRHARPGAGRGGPGRAHPDPGQARRRQEHAVSGARGHVAVGRGDHPAAAARRDDVHAAATLSAARHAARRGELPRGGRPLR